MGTACTRYNNQIAMTIFDNDDVILRLLQFLGPRHTIIGIGATNHNLHRLSTSDSLWRIFWEGRCLLTQQDECDDDSVEDVVKPHGAALVFRRAYREIINSVASSISSSSSDGDVAEHSSMMLYQAYITTHTMMKHSNVRVEAYGRRVAVTKCDIVGRSNLITPPCTQTWPGRLSHGGREHADEGGGRDGNGLQRSTLITCLNPSKAWCDDPRCDKARCDKARCGMEGCLRYYRFSPADYYLRVIDPKTTFVRCSWCNVSFCNVHGGGNTNGNTDGYYYNRRPRKDDQKSNSGRSLWYQCDECNLSSCPDCISQVLLTPTDCTEEGSCCVVTAGKPCNRKLCSNCVWRVGRKRQPITTGDVPGGEFRQSSYIVTVRGVEVERPIEWEDFEKCCSKCLRHVEFRWKELAAMQDSFRGFMP